MRRSPAATVFVCTCCRRTIDGAPPEAAKYDEPGHALARRLEELTANDPEITVVPVECLAVCTRPCTIALKAAGKWTYVIGDIEHEAHAGDIAEATRAFAGSKNGVVPWRERPEIFKKGVIARVPPQDFKPSKANS